MSRRSLALALLAFAASACLEVGDVESSHDAGSGGKSGGGGGGGGWPSGGSSGTAGAEGGAAAGGASGSAGTTSGGAGGVVGGGGGTSGEGGSPVGGGGIGGGSGGTASGGSAGACGSCSAGNCTCVGPAPSGWTYARIAIDPAGAVSCPPELMTAQSFDTGLTDPGCGACSCGAPQGAVCNVKVTGYSTKICGGSVVFQQTVAGQTCVASAAAAGVDFQHVFTPGSCAPNATLKPAAYTGKATVCEAPTGCACIPVAGSAFKTALCVSSNTSGDKPCPAGYSVKYLLGKGFNDNRSCTGCSCGPTAGQTCDSSGASVACNASCSSCLGTPDNPGCHDATQPFGLGLSATIKGGSCQPMGTAKSTGSLAPATTQIVCCDG